MQSVSTGYGKSTKRRRMKKYLIKRQYEEGGTYGEMLREDGSHVAYTCERSENDKTNPCIPENIYLLERYNSPKHGPNTWQFMDVSGRTYIQIHIANWPSQLLGCIALGVSFGDTPDESEHGVLSSGVAVGRFMKETENEKHIVVEITKE